MSLRPALAALAVLLAMPLAAQPLTVESPDGRTVVTVHTAGDLAYSVTYDGEPLIDRSRLGVVLGDGDVLGGAMRVVDTEQRTHDETWEQPWGEVREIRDHHTERTVRLVTTDRPVRRMNLVVRVFDGAVGFRYEWPEQVGLGAFEIMDELTEFRIAGNPATWYIRAQEENRYEYLYEEMPLSRTPHLVHTPLTMQWPEGGPVVSIHEAALVDYAGMSLQRVGRTALKAHLTPWSTGVAVYAEAPHRSPWRMVLIG
ncbi:MAG: glycoside hydrolase family 97 N-terminal domain-containing protein, partial [Bacteroidota bacterium]